ncbi:MAG: alpha-L-arabinofuranosidase C-terminal domain-containing protein [Planctomycetota bacterium]|jgi:alpha-N-arabinofuranosidase
MNLKFPRSAFIVLILSAWTYSSADNPTAKIVVDTGQSIGKMNPLILGNNILNYQTTKLNPRWSPAVLNHGSGVWNPQAYRPVDQMVRLARLSGMTAARWPGGCGVHHFNWKKMIGPVESRPNQQFGLPEFLIFCNQINAAPVITVADFFGTAQNAADLVEYLNAPDDGKHPWAHRRAQDGHPQPYNILWFEYGNETDHGDHCGGKMTQHQYARNYLEYRRAMKAVDPKIQLGLVLATVFPNLESCNPIGTWPCPVLEGVGSEVDFVIHHCYLPGCTKDHQLPDPKTLFKIALAGGDQIQEYYDDMRRVLREKTGRDDIPIAVTEYNGHFVQEKPVPYRHSLGNALVIAEMLRVFMTPRNKICMANFWEFANEYWGQVKGYVHKGDTLLLRPQFYVFELYAQYFGDQLLEAEVDSPTYQTNGGFGVKPAKGPGTKVHEFTDNLIADRKWQLSEVMGVKHSENNGNIEVQFLGGDVNYLHATITIPAQPQMGYHISGIIKTDIETTGNGVCFELAALDQDGNMIRHLWSAQIDHPRDWIPLDLHFVTPVGTRQLKAYLRRPGGKGTITGKALFRDLRITKYIPRIFPAVPYLSVNASRSQDTHTIYLIIVNKNLDREMETEILLTDSKPNRARARTLTGPGLEATNEKNPHNVKIHEKDAQVIQDKIKIILPPCSLTALEIHCP